MPRNKYPEITEQRILDAATKLFLEKGWDQTTIQDIIDELGDLSRGAFYHHFKSKLDIIDAVTTRFFLENNPFAKARELPGLNGLQKLRQALILSAQDNRELKLYQASLSVLRSPQFIARQLADCYTIISPALLELIEEGNADGSMQVQYPRQVAEVFAVLGNIWLNPILHDVTEVEFLTKMEFFAAMLEALGLPLLNEELWQIYRKAYFWSLRQEEPQA